MTEKAEPPGTLSGQLGRRQPAKARQDHGTDHHSLFTATAPGPCRPEHRESPSDPTPLPTCLLLGLAVRCRWAPGADGAMAGGVPSAMACSEKEV